MDQSTKGLLAIIGQQLDREIFPVVKNSGIVLPSEPPVHSQPLGKELHHERKRKAGSAAARQNTVERSGAPGGSSWAPSGPWPTSGSAQVIGTQYDTLYKGALTFVRDAYPSAQVWEQEDGFWLYSESGLLPGLKHNVSFITGISTAKQQVRSWAFYCCPIGVRWVGPRHTNFPDGSICAYDLRDQTWCFGDSLVTLLDIYSVWALRHLHSEVFGRWPGPQAVPLPYERILELKDDELCGCGSTGKVYKDCCKAADVRANQIAEALKFGSFSRWSLRQPPIPISRFMCSRDQPPLLSNFIS